MENSVIITFVTSAVAICSLIVNFLQYRAGKKGTELSDYEKEIKLIRELQTSKDEAYKKALENKDLEIGQLRKDVSEMKGQLELYSKRLAVLQSAVNRLIGGGCKDAQCLKRQPYPIEELGDILNISESE